MSDWEDDLLLDLKLGPEHLGYMRLGSEVAKLAKGINWNAPESGAQWSKMAKFFNKKLSELVELDKQWSKFFKKSGHHVHATGMLDAWEDFAEQTTHWQVLDGPDELGELMLLLEGTCSSLEEKLGAIGAFESEHEESEDSVED